MTNVFIIAEAGVNHNGSLAAAFDLVEVAAKSGADAIKFQTYNSELLVQQTAQKADYQKAQDVVDESQFEMLKKLELSSSDFKKLKDTCDELEIEFLSTAFDPYNLDFLLDEIGQQKIKIPSGEITNPFLLRHAALKGLPLYLSTGMATMSEIESAVAFILNIDRGADLTLLHCRSAYPTQPRDMALNLITTLKERFQIPVGLSDHSLGTHVPLVAAGIGISVLEKHFTLDRNQIGPDHLASLEPHELTEMIQRIREATTAMECNEKNLLPDEEANRKVARRGLYAARKIPIGKIFEEDDFVAMRPENGTSPFDALTLIGTASQRDYDANETIS